VAVDPLSTGAGWYLSLYPTAGEGGGCFVASIDRRERSYVARGSAADPERAAREAGRRARAQLRRYCAANRLNRLGTLTYAGAGCHDPLELREHVGAFFKNLRAGIGEALPYVWVPEWHKSDHGLHVHFAVGRFVQRSLINEAWGRGFVHIKLLSDLRQGSGTVDEARKAAGYLSKYVTKTFTDPSTRVLGLHRYDVGQGFQPAKVRLYGRSPQSLIDQAAQLLESPPTKVWRSEGEMGWQGPPAIWAQWWGAP
jgi:hypothetical protein